MSIEQLKKILESERVINCHNYREHLKRVGTIIESGMSSWAKAANGYRDGSKDMENRLLPLLEKAVEMAEFYADKENWDDEEFIPTIWDNGKIDLGDKAREFLSEFTKMTEIKKESE